MVRTLVLLLFFLFETSHVLSQTIDIRKNLVYLDGQEYVILEKENSSSFKIKHRDSKELMLEVTLKKTYNSRDQKTNKLPTLLFVSLNKSMGFETDIRNKKELMRFLVDRNIILSNGKLNNTILIDYYDYLDSLDQKSKVDTSKDNGKSVRVFVDI